MIHGSTHPMPQGSSNARSDCCACIYELSRKQLLTHTRLIFHVLFSSRLEPTINWPTIGSLMLDLVNCIFVKDVTAFGSFLRFAHYGSTMKRSVISPISRCHNYGLDIDLSWHIKTMCIVNCSACYKLRDIASISANNIKNIKTISNNISKICQNTLHKVFF